MSTERVPDRTGIEANGLALGSRGGPFSRYVRHRTHLVVVTGSRTTLHPRRVLQKGNQPRRTRGSGPVLVAGPFLWVDDGAACGQGAPVRLTRSSARSPSRDDGAVCKPEGNGRAVPFDRGAQ